MLKSLSALLFVLFLLSCAPQPPKQITWKHLSSTNGDIETPNAGNQQTSSAAFDVDKDGDIDFFVTERTQAPSVVLYRTENQTWTRYIVEAEALHIEAGRAVADIDGDGDLDVVFGGDSQSNGVWWWENPNPHFEQQTAWKRHTIKNSGATKHHDQMFVDCDGDGKTELVFWNQNERSLYLAEIPQDPTQEPWDYHAIYTYSNQSEPPQRGIYPNWKGINEHEGLAQADIDQDGVMDIVGGGMWFKHVKGDAFEAHVVDGGNTFSRSAAGQLVQGGRPEIVLVPGDGRGPMMMYEWKNDSWAATTLIDTVRDGHSISILDFNGDNHLDLFNAEMRLGHNPDAKCRILLGDGAGHFKDYIVSSGYGNHESLIVDLDGDGDYDIFGKPYTWEAPRLDIWLQD